MKQFKKPGSVMNKKMPTLLGLLILVGALVSGLVFFGEGTGVFAPRATPQTEPKKIRITNVSDTAFTISFYTAANSVGFIKYGVKADDLESQASDDRDQLSGNVSEHRLHHITVRGLNPETDYYYVLGTENNEYDSDGEPFVITTSPEIDAPIPAAMTIHGSIATAGGTPAEGSIVYITHPDIGPMSSLVQSSGSWAIPLSQARSKAGDSFANLVENEQIQIFVQGQSATATITHQVSVAEAQPVEELSFGAGGAAAGQQATASAQNIEVAPGTATQSAQSQPQTSTFSAMMPTGTELSPDSSISGRLSELLGQAEEGKVDSSASAVLDISETSSASEAGTLVTNSKPKIKGKAAPNVKVKIEIHSDNQIETEVTADAGGDFEIDLEELKEGLEPGEHTVTYSYIDPETGEVVEVTESFIVEDPDAVKVAQVNNSTGTDYGYDSGSSTDSSDSDSDTSFTQEGEEASSGFPTATVTPANSLTVTPTSSSARYTGTDDVPYGSGNPYPMTSPTASASPTLRPTIATRSAVVATESAMYESGSVTNTIALIVGGFFLIACGSWSWWLAKEMEE